MEGNQFNSLDVQSSVQEALAADRKKRKKKKWIIIGIVVAVIVIIGVAASGGDSSSDTPSQSNDSVSVSKTQEVKGKIGSYVCTVKSAKICTDWSGKKAVQIVYSFTNNGKEPISFDIALDENVYQNGVALESSWLSDEDTDILDVKIKNGITKEVKKVYVLNDTTTDLEVEIGEWLSFDDTKYVTTVKLG